MVGRVAERFNLPSKRRRKLSVDQEAQSCAPQHRMIVLAGSKLQDGRDVFGFEVRIVGQDLFPRGASGQQIEYILHTNAKAANTRATTADVRSHCDSIDRAHVIPPGRAAPGKSHCRGSRPEGEVKAELIEARALGGGPSRAPFSGCQFPVASSVASRLPAGRAAQQHATGNW
jgi:hypothetical protein